MNWTKIWMSVFGTETFLGIDMGFWVSLSAVVILAVLMNIIFWSMKPDRKNMENEK